MTDVQWPGGKRVAVVFNVCVEAWSDGKAPGIGPMGNPLPTGVLDTMAISWAAYGVRRGVPRLLETFARHDVKSSMMVCAVVAERSPGTVKAIADAGHEIMSHSYAMDVMPVMMTEEQERENIKRCTALLEKASGAKVVGWLSPRATSRIDTPRLLAEAGYRWYGDTLDDDLPYVLTYGNRRIAAIPFSTDVNDMPFMRYGNPPRLMLESFRENLEIAKAAKGPQLIDATVHAHIFGRPRGAHYYEQIVATAAADKDVWIATRAQIADLVLAQ